MSNQTSETNEWMTTFLRMMTFIHERSYILAEVLRLSDQYKREFVNHFSPELSEKINGLVNERKALLKLITQELGNSETKETQAKLIMTHHIIDKGDADEPKMVNVFAELKSSMEEEDVPEILVTFLHLYGIGDTETE